MQLRYGGYSHSSNEATITIASSRVRNSAEQSIELKTTWTITGQIHGANQAEVFANCLLLELAYSFDYGDLLFLQDDGTVAHALLNAGSTTGVLITQPPSYPKGDGAEGSTYRSYSITAEASYAYRPQGDNNEQQLLTFVETVQIRGGGPVYAWFEGTIGLPERQIVRQSSLCRATQSGQATGKLDYPKIPPAIWPDSLIGDPSIGRTSPQQRGNILENYGVSWNYEFAAAVPLIGLPNIWGA